jgi:hypothetical protein
MKKITLLLVALFAVVGSVFAADIPASGTVGYLYNKGTGKFITASATIDELGIAFKLKNEGIEADGFHSDAHVFSDPGHVYTYVRFEQNEASGNYFRLISDGFTCSSSGYHKWAVEDRTDGWVIRCIYDREAQIKYDGAEQGYYLATNDEGTALTMLAEPNSNAYWQFLDEAGYQAIAADIIAAKEAAEVQATKDALAAMNEGAGPKAGDDLLTVLFPNAGFDASNNADGWNVTINGGADPKYKVENGNCGMTKYQGAIKMEKTIKGLPAGWYTLKAQAFGRKGDHATNRTKFEAGEELETPGDIFANAVTKQVPNIFEGLIDESEEHKFVETSTAGQFDHENPSVHYFGQVTVDGVNKYVLDNSNSGSYAFSIGKYETELNVYVGEDGVLSFGFEKTTADGGDYCGCDNFRLIYLGDDPATRISSVAEKKAQKAIFNAAGQQMKGLQKGINIVGGQKVYVK